MSASKDCLLPILVIAHVPEVSRNELIVLRTFFSRKHLNRSISGFSVSKKSGVDLFAFRLNVPSSLLFEVRIQRRSSVKVISPAKRALRKSGTKATGDAAETDDAVAVETGDISITEKQGRNLIVNRAWSVICIKWGKPSQQLRYLDMTQPGYLFFGKYPVQKFPPKSCFGIRLAKDGWRENKKLMEGWKLAHDPSICCNWINTSAEYPSQYKMVATVTEDEADQEVHRKIVIWEPLPFKNKVLRPISQSSFFILFSEWNEYQDYYTAIGIDKPEIRDLKNTFDDIPLLGRQGDWSPVSMWSRFVQFVAARESAFMSDRTGVDTKSLVGDGEIAFCTSASLQGFRQELEKFAEKEESCEDVVGETFESKDLSNKDELNLLYCAGLDPEQSILREARINQISEVNGGSQKEVPATGNELMKDGSSAAGFLMRRSQLSTGAPVGAAGGFEEVEKDLAARNCVTSDDQALTSLDDLPGVITSASGVHEIDKAIPGVPSFDVCYNEVKEQTELGQFAAESCTSSEVPLKSKVEKIPKVFHVEVRKNESDRFAEVSAQSSADYVQRRESVSEPNFPGRLRMNEFDRWDEAKSPSRTENFEHHVQGDTSEFDDLRKMFQAQSSLEDQTRNKNLRSLPGMATGESGDKLVSTDELSELENCGILQKTNEEDTGSDLFSSFPNPDDPDASWKHKELPAMESIQYDWRPFKTYLYLNRLDSQEYPCVYARNRKVLNDLIPYSLTDDASDMQERSMKCFPVQDGTPNLIENALSKSEKNFPNSRSISNHHCERYLKSSERSSGDATIDLYKVSQEEEPLVSTLNDSFPPSEVELNQKLSAMNLELAATKSSPKKNCVKDCLADSPSLDKVTKLQEMHEEVIRSSSDVHVVYKTEPDFFDICYGEIKETTGNRQGGVDSCSYSEIPLKYEVKGIPNKPESCVKDIFQSTESREPDFSGKVVDSSRNRVSLLEDTGSDLCSPYPIPDYPDIFIPEDQTNSLGTEGIPKMECFPHEYRQFKTGTYFKKLNSQEYPCVYARNGKVLNDLIPYCLTDDASDVQESSKTYFPIQDGTTKLRENTMSMSEKNFQNHRGISKHHYESYLKYVEKRSGDDTTDLNKISQGEPITNTLEEYSSFNTTPIDVELKQKLSGMNLESGTTKSPPEKSDMSFHQQKNVVKMFRVFCEDSEDRIRRDVIEERIRRDVIEGRIRGDLIEGRIRGDVIEERIRRDVIDIEDLGKQDVLEEQNIEQGENSNDEEKSIIQTLETFSVFPLEELHVDESLEVFRPRLENESQISDKTTWNTTEKQFAEDMPQADIPLEKASAVCSDANKDSEYVKLENDLDIEDDSLYYEDDEYFHMEVSDTTKEERRRRLEEILENDPEFRRILERTDVPSCPYEPMDYIIEEEEEEEEDGDSKGKECGDEPKVEKSGEVEAADQFMDEAYYLNRPPSPFAGDWYTDSFDNTFAEILRRDPAEEFEAFVRNKTVAFEQCYEQVLAGTCAVEKKISISSQPVRDIEELIRGIRFSDDLLKSKSEEMGELPSEEYSQSGDCSELISSQFEATVSDDASSKNTETDSKEISDEKDEELGKSLENVHLNAETSSDEPTNKTAEEEAPEDIAEQDEEPWKKGLDSFAGYLVMKAIQGAKEKIGMTTDPATSCLEECKKIKIS